MEGVEELAGFDHFTKRLAEVCRLFEYSKVISSSNWSETVSIGQEELGDALYYPGGLCITGKDSKDGQRTTSLVVCRGIGWIPICDSVLG